MPSKSTSATDLVEPLSGSDLSAFDATWETVVANFPKLGGITNTVVRRVITCAVLTKAVATIRPELLMAAANGPDPEELFLTMCLKMVVVQQSAGAAAARSASAGCGRAMVSFPIEIKRTGNGYAVQVNATTGRSSAKTSLAVSCRGKGSGLLIGLHPRTRGRTLGRVVGPHLLIGFANSSSKPVAISTTFAFR